MTKKGRVVILMMDSFGIGGAEDAARFGDAGANTLGHIAAARGGLKVPNLAALGLLKAAEASSGAAPQAGPQDGAKINLPAKYGFMREISRGKD
ncbi:MAG: phosphopentomutase, partial [Elusimicrobiales bacterium]|nr:phosphopentomutase [Elusimicrobiales bacterium]